MSHHYSGPKLAFPHGDARLDLTDLYAFPKPGDSGKSILIMDVHPSFGYNPPGPTTAVPFATEALYELKIDTNGDAVADIAYRVRFSASAVGAQTATLRRVEGAEAAGTGEGGEIIISGVPVSTRQEPQVTEAGDYRFFAAWRSDPFFFDTQGAVNNLQFTGHRLLRRRQRVRDCAGSAERCAGDEESRVVGAYAGRRRREMDAGGSRRASGAGCVPCRRRDRRLRCGRTGGRCALRRGVRALAGACGRIFAGRSGAGGEDVAAGYFDV